MATPGLGFKIGFFPHFTNGYLGVELESFGNNNSIRFPIESSMGKAKGDSSLITYQNDGQYNLFDIQVLCSDLTPA